MGNVIDMFRRRPRPAAAPSDEPKAPSPLAEAYYIVGQFKCLRCGTVVAKMEGTLDETTREGDDATDTQPAQHWYAGIRVPRCPCSKR